MTQFRSWLTGSQGMHISFLVDIPFSAQVVAQVVFDNVVKLHGLSKSIVSDRNKIFTSNFRTALHKLMDMQLTLSAAYHPQTDGQSERVNQCLEMFLRCSVYNQPKKWKK